MKKIKRIIATILLSIVLATSSPLYVLAQEAAPAEEAVSGEEATEASPQPSVSPEPTENPSPSPEVTPIQTTNEAVQAQEGVQANQAISAVSYNSGDEEYDEDDLNLDGDEWVRDPNKDYSGNVGDTSIDTGNASAGGIVVNNANQATTTVTPTCSVCVDDVSVENSGNGTDSNNSAGVTTNNTSTVQVDNSANVNNDLDFTAESGGNRASYNVGDSEITTGDSNVSGVLINAANETGIGVVEYNIIEDQTGDVILLVPDGLFGCGTCPSGDLSAQNTDNGADSTNDATIDITNTTNVNVNNDADIYNSMDLVANSGDNYASYNTGGDSSITTGDANVAANLLNFVNSTVVGGALFVVNIFGDLVGDIIFPDNLPGIGGSSLSAGNIGNGTGSDNSAVIDITGDTNVDLVNYADIDNNLNIDANTGGNSASYNTGGDSSIETGEVQVSAEILNLANINLLNLSDEPLWVILVNNMGSWTGQIIGALSGINYSGSDGLVFMVDENGQIVATNSGNGAGSTNTADITSNNQSNVSVDNDAKIVNNVDITANTGDNRASYNTGGDSKIKTGDANVAASIINFINSNIIGRSIMVGVINVFGSWMGDAVPPGEEPDGQSNVAVGGSNTSQNLSTSGGSNSGNGGNGGSNVSSGNSQIAVGQSNSANSNFFSGGGQGLFFFGGGTGNGDNEGGGAGGSDEQGSQVLSAKVPGIISLRINWKILLLSLLPMILFGVLRYRQLSSIKNKNTAVAHEIKKPRS